VKPASRPAADAVNTDDEDADDADDCKFSSTSGDRYSKSTYTHTRTTSAGIQPRGKPR